MAFRVLNFGRWLVLLALLSPGLSRAQFVSYSHREARAAAELKAKLASLRQVIAAEKFSFEVGYTTAMDLSLESLAGTKAPADLPEQAVRQRAIAERLLQIDQQEREKFLKENPKFPPEVAASCSPSQKAFDWRTSNGVTPVQDQNACGSCWAFAAVGAYESSYLIRNGNSPTVSEQHALNCSGAGNCGGGWYGGVFDWMIKVGDANRSTVPYVSRQQACRPNVGLEYRAVAWGYVAPNGGIPQPT